MIGILARKRANLTALAVLAALVAAMFIALGPAQAQTPVSVGDCTVTQGAANTIALGQSCTASGVTPTSDPVAATDSKSSVSGVVTIGSGVITAQALGTTTITVDPSATPEVTFTVEVIPAPSLVLTFNDSDALVGAGTPVTVGIATKAVTAEIAANSVTFKVPSTGLYFQTGSGSSLATSQVATNAAAISNSGTGGSSAATAVLQTAGAPNGSYTITATLDAAVGGLAKGDYTKVLTVGDPGRGLDSVALTLDAGAKASESAGSNINLVATAKNSGGANSNPGDVQSILVSATGATVTFDGCSGGDENFAQLVEDTAGATAGNADLNCDGTVDTTEGGISAVTKFSVNKGTPGVVSVQVTLIGGAAGTATSSELALTFAGSASAISVGEASDNLAKTAEDTIEFSVTAVDTGDRTAKVMSSQITTAIKDSDGNPANTDHIVADDAQADAAKGGDNAVIVTVTAESAMVAAGEYTLEVTLGNNAETTQSVPFTVVGEAANIEVAVDMDEVAIGDVITVTATITDAGGNHIADDATARVEFASAGALELSGFGADSDGIVNKKAEDGTAEARFVATHGSGVAVILVDHGDATGTARVSSGDADTAMADEASIGCLKNLSAFSSWTCEVESSASEVFGWLADRGASALHLHNGATWVRYSVVDGGLVPGSSDFTITDGDILYISN